MTYLDQPTMGLTSNLFKDNFLKYNCFRSTRIFQHESVWLMPNFLSKIKEGAITLNGLRQKVNYMVYLVKLNKILE